jgi:ATP-dependent Lon protease
MLPKRNQKDLQDVPEEARQKLSFVWLETVDDAVSFALAHGSRAPAPQPVLAD